MRFFKKAFRLNAGVGCRGCRRLAIIGAFVVASVGGIAAQPVSLTFRVAETGREPFAREIWANVITPSGAVVRLPAFYDGEHRFSVRARAVEGGTYRVQKVTETIGSNEIEVAVPNEISSTVPMGATLSRSAVRIEAGPPGHFVFAGGERYVPIGMNLAWAPDGRVDWYQSALSELGAARLNWTRIWMSHWGGLNLDWVPGTGNSPQPGMLDRHVAERWDKLISRAEENGVYVQMVLQHHGQYSSRVNPNWSENPWNADHPQGFLASPTEFFTSPKARQLTRQKYRYIIARWGYSPAVLAWELFNEVHWVDALRIEHKEEAVAQWHDEMAAYIRSVDAYAHLITTSTEDLHSAIYRSMDYFQPHLYATNMLAAVRRFDVPPGDMASPVFYGEMGNDHMRVAEAQKAAGVELVPIVWASVMGQGQYPAQVWEGDKILATRRVNELGALASFLTATRLAELEGLQAFEPAVDGPSTVPLRIEGAENWHKRPPLELTVAMDGRLLPEYATIPRILVGSPRSIKEGYADRLTLKVDYPVPATAELRIANAGAGGAEVRVRLEGKTVAQHSWPRVPKDNDDMPLRPAVLKFDVPAGAHTLLIDNPGGADWVDFESLDLGLSTSALAAIGRRSDDFVVVWLWQRNGVFAVDPPAAVTGTVVIGEVPAGQWNAIWWDSVTGRPAAPVVFKHPGGTLRLATPPIGRHAALVLTR